MCQPSQTALYIKEEVAMCLNTKEKPENLQIQTKEGNVMKDEDFLGEFKNEDLLYVCLPIADGEWEPVHVESLESAVMAE